MDIASELAGTVAALETDWATSGDDLDIPYVAMGHLARRVVALADTGEGVDLEPLFDEIEARLSTGDVALRDLLITGFLESLQNLDADRSNRWERLLGPSSMRAWVGLHDLWAGRIRPDDWNRIITASGDTGAR